jgi:hypothetical protein
MLSSFSYFWRAHSSEEHKGFLDVTVDSLSFLAEHVEADSLGEGAALADSHDVTDGETESGGLVASHGVMALFESVVLSDEMEVITTDDDVVCHFVGDNDTLENSASDANVSGERALVVNVVAFHGLLGSLETKSNLLVESNTAACLFGNEFFGVKEDADLLLVGFFVLFDTKFSVKLVHKLT